MAYGSDDSPALCATCYSGLEPGARFCLNCGAAAPANVPNYLVQAILATLCCCTPAGIVAIVYAAQVNGKLAAGDYDGALSYSKNAKTWCWVSFGLVIVLYLIVIVAGIVFGLADW